MFVLPGTMGSTLAVDGNRVWIDRLDLARGGMDDLRIGDAEGARRIARRRQLPKTWCATSRPRTKWCRSLRLATAARGSAAALRKAIDAKLDALEGTDQPVRILAHSMGGLVVRTMLATAEGQATWKRMCAHPGARFVMLGTPNGGSHAIGAMLMGRDPLVKQLALLDLRHDYAEILAIIAEFDGALQLLPHAGTLDLYDPAAWQRLHAARRQARSRHLRQQAGRPLEVGQRRVDRARRAARLDRARASRDLLRTSPLDPTG